MALPTLAKTWEIEPNVLIPADANNYTWHRVAMLTVVNTLLGFTSNPLTMVASSDAASDGWPGPGWNVYTDLNWNLAGSLHSWMVLENVDGVQFCIDLANQTAYCEKAYFWMSASGAFTGGDKWYRPTAIDEHECGMAANPVDAWTGYTSLGVTYDMYVHAWHSTDGEVTRLIMYYQDKPCSIWRIEKFQNPRTGHTVPYGCGVNAGIQSDDMLSVTKQEDTRQMQSDYGGLGMDIHPLGVGRTGSNLMERGEMIVAEEIDDEMAFAEIGLSSPTLGGRGPKGKCFDLWWGQYRVVLDGDTYPNSPTAKQFVQCGALIFPWTGDATIMKTH